MIALAFVVDWVGLSLPGFSYVQWRLILTGGVMLLLAIAVRVFGLQALVPVQLPSSGHQVKQEVAALWRSIRARPSDVVIAFGFFCVAVVVVTLYISAFISSGIGSVTSQYHDYATGNPPTFQYVVVGNTPVCSLGGKFQHIPLARIISPLLRMFTAVFPYISLLGILFGVVVVLVYGIFRLGMGRIVAILCTLSFMISSTQLNHLVPFWDKYYVRAPFVLSLVLIMGILVVKPFSPSRTIGFATVAGVVTGVGLMFRPDLLVFFPIIALTLFCFLPSPMHANLKVKLAALMFFVLALFFSFSTCPRCRIGRGANSHAVLNGSTPMFDAHLGLISPGYDWGYLHLDNFTSSMSFAQARVFDNDIPFSGYGPVDDKLRRVVINFPADMLVRFYASALRVMEIPFTYTLPPAGVTDPLITSIYSGRAVPLNFLAGSGLWLCAAALLMISAHSLRKSMFCLLLLPPLILIVFVHLVGYYFFYLEFVTYWALGFVFQHGLLCIARLAKQDTRSELRRWVAQPRRWWNPATQRVVGVAFAVALFLWTPLFVLRQYQSAQAANILRQYDTAALESLLLEALPLENNGVLLSSPQFKPLTEKSFKIVELMAEFSDQKCGYSTVWATLRYEGIPGEVIETMDWSRSISIDLAPPGTGVTRLFFPAMAQRDILAPGCSNYFTGIEMSAEQRACLRGLYIVKDPRQLPILLTVKRPLAGDALYRQLAEWEGSRIHTVPNQLPATRVNELLAKPLLPITDAEIDYRDPIVHLVGGKSSTSLRVHGYVKDNSDINPEFPVQGPRWQFGRSSLVDAESLLVNTDLLITKAKWHKKGSVFVVRGKLYSGGVVFGLMKGNRPSGSVVITNPGKFVVIIEVPQDGMYAIGLASYVTYYNTMENRLAAQAGWVEK